MKIKRQLTAMLAAGALGIALAAPGIATSTDAPGNNGTVKIHEGSTEAEPIVRNEPHVCTFHLHFFFADPFQAGTWEIQEWAPDDKGVVVLTGTYDTNGDGEDRDPDSSAYELPDGHYKLFWDGDLDTEKHDKMKVFWVDCAPEETEAPSFEESQAGETEAPSEVPSVPPSFEQSQAGETEAPSEVPSVPPSFEQSQAGETEVPTEAPSFEQSVGGLTEAPSEPDTATIGTGGPASPADSAWLLVVALGVLLASVVVLTPARAQSRR